MPDTQRNQGQNYDPHHTADIDAQGQRGQEGFDDSDDSMGDEQSQRPDQRQASNTGQGMDDDDYNQGRGNTQSNEDY